MRAWRRNGYWTFSEICVIQSREREYVHRVVKELEAGERLLLEEERELSETMSFLTSSVSFFFLWRWRWREYGWVKPYSILLLYPTKSGYLRTWLFWRVAIRLLLFLFFSRAFSENKSKTRKSTRRHSHSWSCKFILLRLLLNFYNYIFSIQN